MIEVACMKDIKFLENNGVDIAKSLELFGDVETYNETIGEFLVGIHTKISKLIDYMKTQDLNNYAITVHSMKSDARYFGFTTLADMAYEHELKSKAGDFSFITSHINDLINETNRTIKLLQQYISGEEEGEVEEKTSDDKIFLFLNSQCSIYIHSMYAEQISDLFCLHKWHYDHRCHLRQNRPA